MNNADRIAILGTTLYENQRFSIRQVVVRGTIAAAHRNWIKAIRLELSELGALQCEACSTWYPEDNITLVNEFVSPSWARSLDDCTDEQLHVCQQCVKDHEAEKAR